MGRQSRLPSIERKIYNTMTYLRRVIITLRSHSYGWRRSYLEMVIFTLLKPQRFSLLNLRLMRLPQLNTKQSLLKLLPNPFLKMMTMIFNFFLSVQPGIRGHYRFLNERYILYLCMFYEYLCICQKFLGLFLGLLALTSNKRQETLL